MDRIGPFSFIRLSRPPERVSQRWEILARAGVPGVALWDTGVRGEPFSVDSEAVALNYVLGREFLLGYKTLEFAGPTTLSYGTLEMGQFYKVLKVELTGPGVKAIPRAHVANDATWYTALVFARWDLIALDPFVQRP